MSEGPQFDPVDWNKAKVEGAWVPTGQDGIIFIDLREPKRLIPKLIFRVRRWWRQRHTVYIGLYTKPPKKRRTGKRT